MAANVVVLEDDSQFVSAIQRFFRAEKIEAMFFDRPEAARSYIESNNIKLLIVDCLLPGISGLDFVTSIRAAHPANQLNVVLMSGVFTEGSFIRDALRSTKAVAFLKKPFELSELSQYLSAHKKKDEHIPHPRQTLYQIYGKNDVTGRQRKKTIEALEEIYGYDIPFLYALLVETEASGHLNIVNERGKVFGISFSNGSIVSADTADEDTFIGRLLVEAGYLRQEDVGMALGSKEQRMLGESLIANNAISPHIFDAMLSQQTSLRLARTIADENVRVNFVETDVEPKVYQISPDDFWSMLHDWSASKISMDWLSAHFTPWMQAKLRKNPSSKLFARMVGMPLVSHHEGLFDFITSGKSFSELIESKTYPEAAIYKSVYFLITSGVLIFQNESEISNLKEKENLYRRLHTQLEAKDVYQVMDMLSAMTKTSSSQPSVVYDEFVRFLGDPPSDHAESVHALYASLLDKAKEFIKKAESPDYQKNRAIFSQGDAQKKLLAAKLFEEARQQLMKAQFREAGEKLKRVHEMDGKFRGVTLHAVWAKLGGLENNPQRAQKLHEVEIDLLQVEPEEKLEALYSYVMGLIAKLNGDMLQARKYFEKALMVDANMLVARRELGMIKNSEKNKTDLFNADLRTLVGNLFNRK